MLAQVLALTGAATLAMAQSHPNIQPPINWDQIESGLTANLHSTASTKEYWGAGWIPQACKDIASQKGLNPQDFTVFNIRFNDVSNQVTNLGT